MVSLYRKERDASVRYVTITDRQQNLFGYPTLTVITGRDFLMTREKHFTYADEAEMQQALRRMIDRRLSSGYAVLYSYFGEDRFGSIARKIRRLDSTRTAP